MDGVFLVKISGTVDQVAPSPADAAACCEIKRRVLGYVNVTLVKRQPQGQPVVSRGPLGMVRNKYDANMFIKGLLKSFLNQKYVSETYEFIEQTEVIWHYVSDHFPALGKKEG